MGNFSISHYAGIKIGQDFIELRYLLDMAEIPTFQEVQEMQRAGVVPKWGDPSLADYLERKAEILKAGLTLEVDGRPLVLQLMSKDVIFPPGAGGLPTMKVRFIYRAPFSGLSATAAGRLYYRDHNFPDRAGWKEVVAAGEQGIQFLSSSVPERDRSQQLANYPTDLLNTPPQVLEAEVSFTRSGQVESQLTASSGTGAGNGQSAENGKQSAESSGLQDSGLGSRRSVNSESKDLSSRQAARAAATESSIPVLNGALPKPETRVLSSESMELQANKQSTPRNRFTELIATTQFGFWFLLTAAAIAAGLGAFHALEPGHGKTIVAAFLVGSGGTAAHACLLGLIVTASHTVGVYLLGAVTLYASRYVVPERLYPWLGAVSGLTIAGLGVFMFLRRYGGGAHGHSHPYGHAHPHDHSRGVEAGHSHDHEHVHGVGDHDHQHHHHHHHGHDHHPVEAGKRVSYRQLLALGVTGGMVPCPAALVVLLSAIALHRIAFGLFLILAFSVGLATVLISIGLAMVYAGRFMSRMHGDGPLMTRWLPLGSAVVITVLGVAIALQSLVAAGVLEVRI